MLGTLLFSILVYQPCTSELVPVYIWGSQRVVEPSPALHRLSQSSFQDEIVNNLKDIPRIVVFAEQSLSPEDLGHRDSSGNVAFPNLSKVYETSKVTYLMHVQNPLKALENSFDDVEEISVAKLEDEGYSIPDAQLVIINLNDATDDERRSDMLKRHDELISQLISSLKEKDENILAIYTAHHASWTGPSLSHLRKIRALTTDTNATVNKYMDNDTILFYTSGDATILSGSGSSAVTTTVSLTYAATSDNSSVTLTGSGTDNSSVAVNVSFRFVKSNTAYWYLDATDLVHGTSTWSGNLNSTVYAPLGFSYTCGNQTFSTDNFSITFLQFQVEPVIFKSTYLTKQHKFDDPYNCVGFTTIPIWSGLFVTFIFLLIMTFGLTMMMDIRTMDRFDDAKGKTITINTSE